MELNLKPNPTLRGGPIYLRPVQGDLGMEVKGKSGGREQGKKGQCMSDYYLVIIRQL